MNQRIRELAEQAGIPLSSFQFSGIPTKYEVAESDLARFAELIVNECVEILGTYEDYWNHYEQMEMLKKHFGVEE